MISAEVPGIPIEDLDITLTGNMLTLAGEKKSESEETEGGLHRQERTFGRFTRAVSLPATVDSAMVSAKARDGILTIQVAKKEEARPKSIKIDVG